MKFTKNTVDKIVFLTFLICVFAEISLFVFAPKQAYMQGLLESWYARNGLLFYKDIVNAYPPFLKFLMYLFHFVAGYSLIPSALLSPILSIGALALLYIQSRKWLTGIVQIVPIVFFEIWNNYLGGNMFSTTSFLGLLLFIAFLLWINWWQKPTRVKSALLGLMFSFSVMTLQILVPFITTLGLSILFRSMKARKVNYFLIFCLWFIVPWLVLFAWVLQNNILSEFMYWNFFYYFGGYPYSSLGRDLIPLLVFFSIHSPFVIFLFTANKDKKNILLNAFTIISITVLLLTFWLAVFHPMRFQISLPIISFLFGMALEKYAQIRRNRLFSFIVGGVIGFNLLIFAMFVWPKHTNSFSVKNVDRLISEVYPGDPMYDSVEWAKVNIPEGSRIFVWADTYFYLAAKRLPANPRNTLGVEPILFYPVAEFKKEIIAHPPDYWVIDERLFVYYSSWKADDAAGAIKDFLKCQKLLKKFDYWAIYQKNEANPSCILPQ